MLRRRKKSGGPREDRGAHVPAGPRSRRRPRPGAIVPTALQLGEAQVREARQAATVKPAAKAPPATKPPAAAKPTVNPPAAAKPIVNPPLQAKPQAKAQAHGNSQAHAKPPQPADRRKRGGEVILVTGFEPFGGESVNPSWEICERLPREIGGLRVETCLVPCAFREAIEVVADAVERHRPALVVSLGQAGGRAHLSVERVAINIDDARIEDNAGAQPVDERVAPDGPAAHFATVPVKAMVAAMRAAGVPADVSNTAGTFVCNHLMYGVLHFIEARGFATRAGFIHVPHSEEQVLDRPGIAGMAVDSMVRGVSAAIEAAVKTRTDPRIPGGALN